MSLYKTMKNYKSYYQFFSKAMFMKIGIVYLHLYNQNAIIFL